VAALAQGSPTLGIAGAALHREGCVAERVRALVRAHDRGAGEPGGAIPRGAGVLLAALGLVLAGAAASLASVHSALERLVHLLS
jgi:hypothetical protein